jgi:glucoamylase
MMPEQIWDEASIPGAHMKFGQPGGSAVPLVWAHAEYLKLLRSAVDGKVFDRIDAVYERYCEPKGRKKLRRDLEIFSFKRPIQKMVAGSTLRILDEKNFEVTWTTDGWQTTHTAMCRSLGSAGHSAEIVAGKEKGKLEWTLRWTEQNAWLGYNVEILVEA